jgi:hypothetical protein
MGQNSDINNIFNSYRNNVLLNEAVKSVEVNEPAKPLTPEEKSFKERAASYGKNWTDAQARIMFARQQEVDKKNGTNYANQPESQKQQQAAPQPAQQPAQQPASQSAESSDDSGQVGTWTGDSYGETITLTVGSNGNLNLKNSAGSNSGKLTPKGSGNYDVNIAGQSGQMNILSPSSATLTVGSNTMDLQKQSSQQSSQQEQPETEDNGTQVGETERENVTDQYTSDESSDNEDLDAAFERLKSIYLKTKSEQEETPVTEKTNIAYFLKCLSEKNYAKANKYLNNIMQYKIKKTILKEIK